jgi:hypothetical protein
MVVIRKGGCRRSAPVRIWFLSKTTGLSFCTADIVAVPNIQREFTLNFGRSLPEKEKCSRQYEEN